MERVFYQGVDLKYNYKFCILSSRNINLTIYNTKVFFINQLHIKTDKLYYKPYMGYFEILNEPFVSPLRNMLSQKLKGCYFN